MNIDLSSLVISMKKRKIVSIVLAVCFALLVITGLLDLMEAIVGEMMGTIGKVVHIGIGLIFTVAAIFHIIFNRTALKSYLKR
jgi:thiosulfate reductase cytochrome b subunit